MNFAVQSREIPQLEGDVVIQPVDEFPLRLCEPFSLFSENLDNRRVTHFTDKRQPRQLFQPLAVRNGGTEPVGIAILLDQVIPVKRRQQDHHKIPRWKMKQQVFLEPAVLPESDAGIADQLIGRESVGTIVVHSRSRQGRSILHLDENRRFRVFPGDDDITFCLSLIPLEMVAGIVPLLLPEFDPQIAINLPAETIGAESQVQEIGQPPAGIEDFQDAEELPLTTMSSATGRALTTLVNPTSARHRDNREFRARSGRDAGVRVAKRCRAADRDGDFETRRGARSGCHNWR